MAVERGWAKEAEIGDEEAQRRRQEAISEYGVKISDLKKQESDLKDSIGNLKDTIEAAVANRLAEISTLEESLKSKIASAEDLNIKNRAINAQYEEKLSALAIETSVFESYKKEKQEEIDRKLADIEFHKNTLAIHQQSVIDRETRHTENVTDHCKKVSAFNEEKAAFENKHKQLDDLILNNEKEAKRLKDEKESNAQIIQEAISFKVDYQDKLASLDGLKKELSDKKEEYENKLKSLNQEKDRMNNVFLQQKSERLELDKRAKELNDKQKDVCSQIEKLEELKATIK